MDLSASLSLNADFTAFAVAHTAAMEWQESPSPTVWRKRLDLSGPAEAGRVTSVVRYDADSSFSSHEHPDGEEILVLDGVFSDEHGDYPAGSYLLNPEGFSHAPFSEKGCVLFVKLRQYPGLSRRQVKVDSASAPWRDTSAPGVLDLLLYEEAGYPETMRLVCCEPHSGGVMLDHPGGTEIFVLDGAFNNDADHFVAGSWLRVPAGEALALTSETGGTVYVKSGHLAA